MEDPLYLLNEIAANNDLSGFYNVRFSPTYGDLTLQGKITKYNIQVANKLGITLSLIDEDLDGKHDTLNIRIILTS